MPWRRRGDGQSHEKRGSADGFVPGQAGDRLQKSAERMQGMFFEFLRVNGLCPHVVQVWDRHQQGKQAPEELLEKAWPELRDFLAGTTFAPSEMARRRALDGDWQSTDGAKRFRLQVDGLNVRWTEVNPEKPSLSQAKNMAIGFPGGDALEISRPNDDQTLRMLGFNDGVRAAVLARSPKPSTLTLRRKGDGLAAEWRGIVVTKDKKDQFQSLKQPGETPAKPYELVRSK